MKKVGLMLFFSLLIAGCTNAETRLDSVATANAPWKKNDLIIHGFCDQSGNGWCIRFFRGITTDGKVLVQDYYAKIAERKATDKLYNPRTNEIETKFSDPFTMMTPEDAQMNLFHADDGKDGFYRSYYLDGDVREEGVFRKGVKHGIWHIWFTRDTGYKKLYKNGELIQSWEVGDWGEIRR